MTVGMLQQQVSSSEFSEWIAYDRLDPFGDERADVRQGLLTAAFYNANRAKGGRNATPQDFVLTQDKSPKQNRSASEIETVLRSFAANRMAKKV